MAKPKTYYVCQSCGDSFTKWGGRCESCNEWNTLKKFKESSAAKKSKSGQSLDSVKISEIKESVKSQRQKSGIKPLDNVLGGGLMPGSVVLIAGQPGIGKSTLLMQLTAAISKSRKVLYTSGEESLEQISFRANRLAEDASDVDLATSTSTEDVAETLRSGSFDLMVVDSIQTIATDELGSSPGSTAQITQSAHMLISAAKTSGTTLVVVGHVTKQGSIAGPKQLEHLVDVVLNLEGDRYGGFKILRGQKNRYGSTNEIGIFEMKDAGLIPVDNPSAAMLAERQVSDGSVVLATLEGTRPLLVEVQALVNQTSFGYPKRTASGLDINRLNLLVAVLSRRTKLNLADKDIYVNIVGGVKTNEPAADLAVCMAIASAAKGMKLKTDSVVFGEVGLSGEVRHVPSVDKRIAEAKKLGFKSIIGPRVEGSNKTAGYTTVSSLRNALNTFLTKK